MARNTGVTTETAKRMIMDAGAIYINYGEADEALFGATREGAEFTVEQDIREIEVDGLRGPTKGFRRIIQEHVRLTVNLLEMTADNVVTSMIGSTKTVDGGTSEDVITRSLLMGDIEYLTNIALVADYSGSSDPVVIILKNALQDGGFSLSATDREESTAELQFTAHIDPAGNLDESPFEIRFPEVV